MCNRYSRVHVFSEEQPQFHILYKYSGYWRSSKYHAVISQRGSNHVDDSHTTFMTHRSRNTIFSFTEAIYSNKASDSKQPSLFISQILSIHRAATTVTHHHAAELLCNQLHQINNYRKPEVSPCFINILIVCNSSSGRGLSTQPRLYPKVQLSEGHHCFHSCLSTPVYLLKPCLYKQCPHAEQ